MGQDDIAKYIESKYPKWISAQKIITDMKLSRVSANRCLRSLRKRDEVEFKVLTGRKLRAGWNTFYRIKPKEVKHNGI